MLYVNVEDFCQSYLVYELNFFHGACALKMEGIFSDLGPSSRRHG